jgi:hypothetical protein
VAARLMALRRRTLLSAPPIALFLVICGIAFGAQSYRDPVGDVKGAAGPDITSVSVSNTRTVVAAAREGAQRATGGGFDIAPGRGTVHYTLSG